MVPGFGGLRQEDARGILIRVHQSSVYSKIVSSFFVVFYSDKILTVFGAQLTLPKRTRQFVGGGVTYAF